MGSRYSGGFPMIILILLIHIQSGETHYIYSQDADSNYLGQGVQVPLNKTSLRLACLEAHNTIRYLHDVPLFEWDDELADGAGDWAFKQATAHKKPAKHSSPKVRHAENFGENVFMKSGFIPSPLKNAVWSWYNEHKCWSYDTGSRKNTDECHRYPTGHFVQEVWKSSTKVGCGAAFYAAEREYEGRTYVFVFTYIVARYNPPMAGGNTAMQGNVNAPIEGRQVPHSPEDLLEDHEEYVMY